MKANETHIGLETAILLKECGVASNLSFAFAEKIETKVVYTEDVPLGFYRFPAFTWQEILWEYPKEFFGEKYRLDDRYINEETEGIEIRKPAYKLIPELILGCLQDGYFGRADQIFKANCIIIKDKL